MLTNAERQRAFKAKMYEAGFKQVQVWVQRNQEQNNRPVKMDRNTFIRKLDELTAGMTKTGRSKLYSELIKFALAKKEESQKKNT
jgi:hypothetical protein